jgi:hypothetical protein
MHWLKTTDLAITSRPLVSHRLLALQAAARLEAACAHTVPGSAAAAAAASSSGATDTLC